MMEQNKSYEEILLEQIDNYENLSRDEKENVIKDLWDYEIFQESNGDEHRWNTYYQYISKVNDRLFLYTIGLGNTETQENDYCSNITEISKFEIEMVETFKLNAIDKITLKATSLGAYDKDYLKRKLHMFLEQEEQD